jgi:cytoskeletal protein RodZ
MSTVAEQLRQAREAQKLTVHQVADITKIRTDHIRALEQGNFDMFTAPVYIRGFVRSYAALLKLDVPQTMAALDAELGRTEKFREPPRLTDQKKGPLDFVTLQLSKVDWRKSLIGLGVIAGMAIVLALFLAWWNRRAPEPVRAPGPGLYRPANTNAGDMLPVPQPSQRR